MARGKTITKEMINDAKELMYKGKDIKEVASTIGITPYTLGKYFKIIGFEKPYSPLTIEELVEELNKRGKSKFCSRYRMSETIFKRFLDKHNIQRVWVKDEE